MIADRLLVALAALRLTTREVGDLRRFFIERSASDATNILHQIEDQLEAGAVQYRPSRESAEAAVELELEQRLRQIYHADLKISAPSFIELIKSVAQGEGKSLPPLDPKKGMRHWIKQYLKFGSASDLLRLASIVKTIDGGEDLNWRLR